MLPSPPTAYIAQRYLVHGPSAGGGKQMRKGAAKVHTNTVIAQSDPVSVVTLLHQSAQCVNM
jgi:hypothetical protein